MEISTRLSIQRKLSLEMLQELYNSNSKFFWLDSHLRKHTLSYLFLKPIDWIVCKSQEEVETKLNDLDSALKEGYWVAGYFTYEFGKLLLNFLEIKTNIPYFHFAVYESPIVFQEFKIPKQNNNFQILNLQTSLIKQDYEQNVLKIQDLIQNGKVYQINYTFFLEFEFLGSSLELYLALRDQQKTDYSVFVFYDFPILSLSPELFFKIKGNKIETKPMKGTFAKNVNVFDEIKNKAENFMITDLLRNDLGKICKIGSVKVKNLFIEEKYSFVNQFTSTITGELKANISFSQIIKALFPSGSITGAPKKESMKHITFLEKTNREIYTGSIGFFSPKKRALFNVAIRTIQLSNQKGKMGIGSGIVFDSQPEEEWKESFVKAKFFLNILDFIIFETVLLKDGKFILKKAHLERLFSSCEFFQFAIDKQKIISEINNLEKKFQHGKYRVKWIIDKKSNFQFEVYDITQEWKFLKDKTKRKKILISKRTIKSNNIFLFHKTSQREFYNSEYENLDKKVFIDKVFFNEKEELTEGCISNVFVLIENVYYTPPISSGLLNGVFREYLLKKFPKLFQEKILHFQEVLKSKKIFICNSLRGILRVEEAILE